MAVVAGGVVAVGGRVARTSAEETHRGILVLVGDSDDLPMGVVELRLQENAKAGWLCLSLEELLHEVLARCMMGG